MPSFGETLKTQRELRGVSLREMADSTKISVRFLRALEEDRLDVLPGGIYPRAFVKQYALFIGLDPERTVADFLLRQGRPEPERRPATAAKWPRLTPGAVFFAVVVVVAAFLTLRRRRRRRCRPCCPPTGSILPPPPSPVPSRGATACS
jgi:cytoskeletal protein RodZ